MRLINGIEYPNDLQGADLGGANLSGADLSGVDLCVANLCRANLSEANLIMANLYKANLSMANLCKASLYEANLCKANLHKANLCEANLCKANLSEANLSRANLCEANLQKASLFETNLCRANLYRTQNIPTIVFAITTIVPQGTLIVYKKLANGSIATLEIPTEAKRSNATGRKCRAEYAKVLDGNGVSKHDNSFIYKTGETVHPTAPFEEDRWIECASGIHFYLTLEEAKRN
jgi:uncharacterized protein YjbI with pentapeptide repeats